MCESYLENLGAFFPENLPIFIGKFPHKIVSKKTRILGMSWAENEFVFGILKKIFVPNVYQDPNHVISHKIFINAVICRTSKIIIMIPTYYFLHELPRNDGRAI